MAYNTIKIHGGGDVNYVMCTTASLTDEEKKSLETADISTRPTWDDYTIMLAKFENESIDANSYEITNDIKEYKIQRLEVGTDRLYEVATVDKTHTSIKDYNVRSQKSYQYRIVPVNNNGDLLAPITTDAVETDWCGWSVVGIIPTKKKNVYTVDQENIWNFVANVKPQPKSLVNDMKIHTGFGKYPTAVQGELNYIETGMSCLIGDITCKGYEGDTIDVIKKWRAFCSNEHLKLFKDPKGEIIPCIITDTTDNTDFGTAEQITEISFKVTQLLDETKISVYGLEAV